MRSKLTSARGEAVRTLALSLMIACVALSTLADDRPRLKMKWPVQTATKAPTPVAPESDEPTDEETLILELMNRFRADPSGEADRILDVVDRAREARKTRRPRRPGEAQPPRMWIPEVDWKMFEKELKELKPAPPLVFNLKLIKVARNHSVYQIHNGMTHVEEKGKKGFTGVKFTDRYKHVGYRWGTGAENCYLHSSGPVSSHLGFIIDWGKGGPGGMQPGRGHRRNMMNNSFREVGVGGIVHSRYLCVTHNFGNRRVPRFAGGVVYVDRNHNRFYDMGEGVGDVEITASDGTSTKTWKSGAYVIELKSTKPVTIRVEREGMTHSQRYAAGKSNIKFDWIIPPEEELKKADALIAAVEQAAEGSKARTQAALRLYFDAQQLTIDEGRQKRIEVLTGPIVKAFEADRKGVLDALKGNDSDAFTEAMASTRRKYFGTPGDEWFSQALWIETSMRRVVRFETRQAKMMSNPKPLAEHLVKQIEATKERVKFDELRSILNEHVKRIRAALESAKD